MIINVSFGKANYSQRNNLIRPFESCNVTSMVMALSYLGYTFPRGDFEQPEDNLRQFMVQRGKNPIMHYDLSESTNRWMQKDVTSFGTGRKINDIFTELLEGRPVVISGNFPGYPTKKEKPLGHIVCLVGAEWAGATTEHPDAVIWDDPYGDTLRDWQGSGNDIKLDYQKFIDWIKPVGDIAVKWGHFFTKR
jgi:uncharacterized protein YvpB